MAPPPRKPNGVEFPQDDKGERSTTSVNQSTFEAAIRPVDSAAADAVKKQKGWRFTYNKHVVTQVKTAVKSEANAYAIAEAGEAYLHNQMRFIRDDVETSLAEAMQKYTSNPYKTAMIKGSGSRTTEYTVPYNGKDLTGPELAAQIESWVRSGVIELSCGSSLLKVCENAKWLDLTGEYFVLFGAASAMGPYPLLMALGANVIALDLDREGIWKMLIEKARASAGTLIFPVTEDQGSKSDEELAKIAGCDLLGKTPEIRTWLMGLYPEERLILGAYAYLDGPLFVKLSVAMDAIIKELVAKRKVKPSIAYLCTPTDAHPVPSTAMAAAKSNYNRQPMWQKLCSLLLAFSPAHRMSPNFQKPVDGTDISVCDAIVPPQGPNYILAKRLQHWRAILARRDGCTVSTNIAPSTATKSVVSNKAFALAYKGMHHFKPIEVFQQETSNAVMTGLLLADLNDKTSAANPERKLANPMLLFSDNSFHGGAWRCGYKFGQVGTPSVLAALFLMMVVTPYMVLYNYGQVAGWGYALAGLVQHELEGTGSGLWAKVGETVTSFQMLAWLEVVHALVGITRSGVMTTFIQVLSRVFVVSVMNAVPAAFEKDVMWTRMMLFAWSLTEVVRYSYYGPIQNKLLTWLRYTLFIVLYPMGVAGEIGTLNHAVQNSAPATEVYSFLNVIQQVFKLGGLPLVIGVYLVGLSGLYTHMLAQRSRVLGKSKAPRRASSEKKNQ
eukprot:TRINITY_DN17001_c0_g3_i1.p1 TRINITY_DN17001_c0_g3~~TRINITY_DN17001_c0_g3_i1.p1  ORF type:complete len:739 (+),score=296.22 TRINITY_DN17001_c0_g3_i1:48-2219(+)